MNSKRCYSVCCFVVLHILLIGFARAQQVQLSISPTVCIVNKMGQPCAMNVKVAWRTSRVGDYCLFRDEQQLKCWRNADNVTTNFEISLQENMLFTLRDKETLLAQKQNKVNASAPKAYRRRLRADWSVF